MSCFRQCVKVVVSLLLIFGAGAQAATYYLWKVTAVQGPFTSMVNQSYATGDTVCSTAYPMFQTYQQSQSDSTYTYQNFSQGSCTYSGGASAGAPISTATGTVVTGYGYDRKLNSNGSVTHFTANYNISVGGVANTTTCTSGQQQNVGYSTQPTVGSNYCTSDHCEVTIDTSPRHMITTNGMRWLTTATATGNACNLTSPSNQTPTYTGSAGQPCYIDTNGTSVCVPPTGTNCGTVNGEPVCLSAVPAGSCITTASGAGVCGSTAKLTSPPAPNNGSSTSTPATPTVTMNGAGGTEVNYYNTTTMVNQASGGSSSSAGSGSSSSGGSASSASSGSSGSASGGLDCTAQPVCTGDTVQCSQLLQEWLQRCPGAPSASEIASALGTVDPVAHPSDIDVSGSSSFDSTRFGSSSGSCPGPYNIPFMGTNLSFNPMPKVCEFGSIFRVFALAFAYFVAGSTVLSAAVKDS